MSSTAMPSTDAARVGEHPPVQIWIIQLNLRSGCICSLCYFRFQPLVHKWSIKGCPVCGKVYIKDPLLLIGKRSLGGRKYEEPTICYESHNSLVIVNGDRVLTVSEEILNITSGPKLRQNLERLAPSQTWRRQLPRWPMDYSCLNYSNDWFNVCRALCKDSNLSGGIFFAFPPPITLLW